MNIAKIFKFTGRIMLVMAALALLPIAVAIWRGEENLISSFLITAGVFLTLWALSLLIKTKAEGYDARDGFAITALSWLFITLIGALPFWISREIPSYIDAFFETVSGFTTTGSSILSNVENLSDSMLFWRSFSHWVGGMGVLAFGIALFPVAKGQNRESGTEAHILKAESPGPTYGKFVSKLRFNTRILYLIYLAMTVVEIVLLVLGGMPFFDSLLNSLGTAGTGGFAIKNAGIAAYNEYCRMVIAVFMVLFGVNFNFYYFMLIGKLKSAFKMEEVKWYIGIVLLSTAAITANLLSYYDDLGESFRYAFFQVSSIITTTGYATANFDLWPAFSKVIIVLLMFIGACAGSTAGGLKVSRVIILIKSAIKELWYSVNPRAVRVVKCDGEPLDRSVVINVGSYFAIYMLITAISTLLVSIDGYDTTTTFTSVVSCFNNIGPALGLAGPYGNFGMFSVFSKIVLSLDMLLGRLEIFPLIVLFSPKLWKNG